MKNELVIKNGRVIDPSQGLDEIRDLHIADGVIKSGGRNLPTPAGAKEIDASGMIVSPGLIDMHTHLREPGREDEETLSTGTRAAAAGGFTSVCCMPNSIPVCDTRTSVKYIIANVAETGVVNVHPVAAITMGQNGDAITEFGDLVEAGAIAFSDDGHPVMNAEIMRRALQYSRMFNIPVLQHAEDQQLCEGAVMNESFESTKLGLKGAPPEAEEIAVLRDIALARSTGGRVHFQHITTKRAIEAIRQAKKEGIRVTAEAAPHHLVLNDAEIAKAFNTNLRVNPPLRSESDRQALIEGLVDGTIDCIASDHAPHSEEEKDCEFDLAPPGMIGLETSLALINTFLIEKGLMNWADVIRKMTVNPAHILKLPGGTLAVGSSADITIIDPEKKWTVRADKFRSKSKNSPYIGWKLTGQVARTILGGRTVYQR